jgi:predicted nucleic acid-binding Zn ribbon protein
MTICMQLAMSLYILIIAMSIVISGSTGAPPTVNLLSFRALGASEERHCTVCGSPAKPRNLYCPRCRKFIFRKPNHKARAAALIESWDPVHRRFRCWYTGIPLNETNPWSRRYLTFDHVIPGDDSRLVVSCRLINEMKSDLTWDEFFTVIAAFDIYRKTGVFPKETVNLEHWSRTAKPLMQAGKPIQSGKPVPPEKGATVAPCEICGQPSFPGSEYCPRHRRFLFGKYERKARLVAFKRAWSAERNGFVCEYTGVLLDETDPNSPWYVSIDHRFPGKKGNLAVCARFVNSIKANLTAKQFATVMEALARMMDGEPFDEKVIPA